MEVNRPVEIDIQVQWLTFPSHSFTCMVLDDFAVMILVFILSRRNDFPPSELRERNFDLLR